MVATVANTQAIAFNDNAFQNTLGDIGAKITALRRQKGYTSHESFAHDFDLPRAQYWRLEKGKANFTIKTLSKVLAIHNLTLHDFFCQSQTIQET